MSIVINLDVMMAKRKIGLTELAKEVDITMANLSILKNNKASSLFHVKCDLQSPGLPAGGYIGVCARGYGYSDERKGNLTNEQVTNWKNYTIITLDSYGNPK